MNLPGRDAVARAIAQRHGTGEAGRGAWWYAALLPDGAPVFMHAIPAALGGHDAPLQAYAAALVEIRRIYRARLRTHYADEQRWPEAPFWRERTPAAA
jgi:hypothetical protein